MGIEEIYLEPFEEALPDDVERLIAESDRLVKEFYDADLQRENPNFVPCDPRLVYGAIEYVTRLDLPVGKVFCEWGSGFGVATGLAGLLGYDAYGIELDSDLAEHSQKLGDRLGIGMRILNTSYLPEGYSTYTGQGGEELVKPEGERHERDARYQMSRYEGMDCDTDEIDVFFIYPWPREHEMMQDLFEAIAGDGAILIAYYGDGEMCAYRKIVEDLDLE